MLFRQLVDAETHTYTADRRTGDAILVDPVYILPSNKTLQQD